MPVWTAICKTLGLKLARAAVGDRYVLEEMKKGGFNVGGEQSGHIILSDFATTGDGLIAALQVLAVLAEEGKPASEAAHLFEPLPQVLENVRFKKGLPLEDARVKKCIEAGTARLNGIGPHPGAQIRHRARHPRDGGRRRREARAPGRARDRRHHRGSRRVSGKPARVLVIAGSDSSGGAGIQADIKTAMAFGVYAQTAITAVTVQNTKGVQAIHPVPPAIVAAQIEAVPGRHRRRRDQDRDARFREGREGGCRVLAKRARKIPIVLDPVMVSTSGHVLLATKARQGDDQGAVSARKRWSRPTSPRRRRSRISKAPDARKPKRQRAS